MQALLGLLLVTFLVNSPWVLILIGFIVFAVAGFFAWGHAKSYLQIRPAPSPWTRVEPRFEQSTNQNQHPERATLMQCIEQLERDLKEARTETRALRSRNEQLERDLQSARTAPPPDSTNPLFRRVGLHQDAPEWVIAAVRKAYRKRLHPDAHVAGLKGEAERRFKQAEQVFDEIERVKGFRT